MYSLLTKRRTKFGTLVGAISGATPPVVGYVAVANRLDAGAIILFLILCLWQMPHFFAIAIYRLKDYTSASVPVYPVKEGILSTKKQILYYIAAFIIAASLLTFFGYTSYAYLGVVVLLGTLWLSLGIKGFRADDDKFWARKMFFASLLVLTVLFLTISVDSLI
jgi:protoheme IX farnesyltransferase